jgi:hypothetical protein
VGRRLDADYLDRVRGYQESEPYAKAMRKRQVWVEPLFAEAKAWHGLRRFRLRGLENVNGEALLIAAGQNLKRLLSRWGWGRPVPERCRRVRPPGSPASANPDAVTEALWLDRLPGSTPRIAFFNRLDRS